MRMQLKKRNNSIKILIGLHIKHRMVEKSQYYILQRMGKTERDILGFRILLSFYLSSSASLFSNFSYMDRVVVVVVFSVTVCCSDVVDKSLRMRTMKYKYIDVD